MKSGVLVKIIIAVLVVCVAGAGIKTVIKAIDDSPKGVVQKLEHEFNDGDVEGVVECFDPSVQSMYSIADSLIGEFAGFSVSDVFYSISFLAPILQEYSDEDISLPKIKLDVTDVEKNGDSAVVYVDVSVYSANELLCEEPCRIDTVRIDGEWYISGEALINSMF